MHRKILIVLTTYKPHAAEIAKRMLCFLKDRNRAVDVYEYDGVGAVAPVEKEYELAISLGGDGTVLFTARFCAPKNIPVFPLYCRD